MGELTFTEWERKNELASQRIQQLLRVLSKSKMLHVLYALVTKGENLRFSEIKKSSFTDSTTLTRRLTELEDIAMISKNEVSTNPPVVEYQLTESFSTIKPILEGLLHYGLEGANNE
tara:strand:- start:144 stop:494 length:351 start_codon:yes stop_codon:yes gene_type:complete